MRKQQIHWTIVNVYNQSVVDAKSLFSIEFLCTFCYFNCDSKVETFSKVVKKTISYFHTFAEIDRLATKGNASIYDNRHFILSLNVVVF